MSLYFYISHAISLFLVFNVLGNLAFCISVVRHFSPRRKMAILLREMIIALGILFVFGLFGDYIVQFLGISAGIIGIAGGILLLIISLQKILFSPLEEEADAVVEEPLVVPIATPGLAGPGSITMVMLLNASSNVGAMVSFVIVLAWAPSLCILLLASYLQDKLNRKGLIILERTGALFICLISVQMISSGVATQANHQYHKIFVSEKQQDISLRKVS